MSSLMVPDRAPVRTPATPTATAVPVFTVHMDEDDGLFPLASIVSADRRVVASVPCEGSRYTLADASRIAVIVNALNAAEGCRVPVTVAAILAVVRPVSSVGGYVNGR